MSSIDIKVFGLNSNGLGKPSRKKRQAVFDKIKRKYGEGIYCFQETHSTPQLEQQFKDQWGSNEVYFSHGTSSSSGVITAISPKYEAKIVNMLKDEEGRILILDIERNGVIFRVTNVYAPCRNFETQQIQFLKNLSELFSDTDIENLVFEGDWNLYLDPKLDKLDTMPAINDNPNYRRELKAFSS